MAEKRRHDVPDDADEKWDYPEHTAAKHEILRRYLGAWLAILGRGHGGFRHQQLNLVDGFAGRGRYMQGQPGSPAIMFERAAQVADDELVEHVLVRCSEPNEVNFGHLKEVCDGLAHPKVTVRPTQETFEELAQRFITYAKDQRPPPPTFIMVDPYGVKGVNLATLKEVLQFERVEVFLTLMVREPARFMTVNYEEPLTALFGGDAWGACISANDRPECLMRTFQSVVTGNAAKYVLPYKVYEDGKQTVLYYLVHMTNNDLGMRVMKEKMVKKSGEMTFFPITLRPTDQLAFDVSEPKPYPTLQAHLASTYAGQTMEFVELLNEDYPLGGSWLSGQYKDALRAMASEEPPRVDITRQNPTTKTGRATRTIEDHDVVQFKAESGVLTLAI
jgi:three-Cys-motif partner protein